MAAIPSPRPVRPRPSVVVALTETSASQAALSAFSASSRRAAKRGRLQITWTETLPISKPAARTRRAASASKVAPEAPAHWGSARTEVRAEVAEPGRVTTKRRRRHGQPRRRRSDLTVRRSLPASAVRPATSAGPLRSGGRRCLCPRVAPSRARLSASSDSASTRSRGRVTLNASCDPSTVCTVRRAARTASRHRSPRPHRRHGPAATKTGSNPCGVCTATSAERLGVSSTSPVGVDPFDRVGHRDHRDHRGRAGQYGGNDPLDHLGGNERPGRVVDQHAVDPLGGNQFEGQPDRVGPFGATGNDVQRAPDRQYGVEQFADVVLGAGGHRDHEAGEVGGGRCPQSTNGVDQQRFATDLSQCLWCLTTEPEPETGRRNDRRSTHDDIMPDRSAARPRLHC